MRLLRVRVALEEEADAEMAAGREGEQDFYAPKVKGEGVLSLEKSYFTRTKVQILKAEELGRAISDSGSPRDRAGYCCFTAALLMLY